MASRVAGKIKLQSNNRRYQACKHQYTFYGEVL